MEWKPVQSGQRTLADAYRAYADGLRAIALYTKREARSHLLRVADSFERMATAAELPRRR